MLTKKNSYYFIWFYLSYTIGSNFLKLLSEMLVSVEINVWRATAALSFVFRANVRAVSESRYPCPLRAIRVWFAATFCRVWSCSQCILRIYRVFLNFECVNNRAYLQCFHLKKTINNCGFCLWSAYLII